MSPASRDDHILGALRAASSPLSLVEIGDAIGLPESRGEVCRPAVNRLLAAGSVVLTAGRPRRYALPPSEEAAHDGCRPPAVDADAGVGMTEAFDVPSRDGAASPPSVPGPSAAGGPETRDRVLAAVYGAAEPIGTPAVAIRAGILASDAGVLLRAFAADGFVREHQSEKGRLWGPGQRAPAPAAPIETFAAMMAAGGPADEMERVAVEVPERGHAGITDPDVLDEIEAEKVWALAGVIRAANTAWGIDAGLDADVREARALMAEARHQVRHRAPLGQHYREGDAR